MNLIQKWISSISFELNYDKILLNENHLTIMYSKWNYTNCTKQSRKLLKFPRSLKLQHQWIGSTGNNEVCTTLSLENGHLCPFLDILTFKLLIGRISWNVKILFCLEITRSIFGTFYRDCTLRIGKYIFWHSLAQFFWRNESFGNHLLNSCDLVSQRVSQYYKEENLVFTMHLARCPSTVVLHWKNSIMLYTSCNDQGHSL